jgi:hypothetical protein
MSWEGEHGLGFLVKRPYNVMYTISKSPKDIALEIMGLVKG